MGRWCAHPQPSRVVIGLFAATLFAAGPAFADDAAWTGMGLLPPGNGSERVNALLLDSATGVLYAGTGSGNVFAYRDSSLSRAPVARSDSVTTTKATAVAIDVAANDFDPDGALDSGSLAIKTGPGNGTATVDTAADGTATYTPASGFTGTDSFTYTVRDAAGLESNVATVTVNVRAAPSEGGGGSRGNGSSGSDPSSNGSGGSGGTGSAGSGPGSDGSGGSGGAVGGGFGGWGLFGGMLLLGALSRRWIQERSGA